MNRNRLALAAAFAGLLATATSTVRAESAPAAPSTDKPATEKHACNGKAGCAAKDKPADKDKASCSGKEACSGKADCSAKDKPADKEKAACAGKEGCGAKDKPKSQS